MFLASNIDFLWEAFPNRCNTSRVINIWQATDGNTSNLIRYRRRRRRSSSIPQELWFQHLPTHPSTFHLLYAFRRRNELSNSLCGDEEGTHLSFFDVPSTILFQANSVVSAGAYNKNIFFVYYYVELVLFYHSSQFARFSRLLRFVVQRS